MFSSRKWLIIGSLSFFLILAIYFLGLFSDYSTLTNYWFVYAIIIGGIYFVALGRSYYYFRRSREEMFPRIRERVIEKAEESGGIITLENLEKVPPQWYDWIIEKFEEEDIAKPDPTTENGLLFPEIIAETHTQDEVMELNLPSDTASDIYRMAGRKNGKR